MYEINKSFKKIIDEKGFKIRKIAERSGIKESAVGDILRCKRRIYAEELLPLCSAVGVELAEVI